jgi:hypothetical protein
MKIDQLFKYVGLAALAVTFLFFVGGIISFYTGEFLNVRRFSNFFWFGNSFALFGIFNMVVYLALRNPDKK